MNENLEPEHRFVIERDETIVREIRLTNLLSFGPKTASLPLGPLNILIGPNGAGKSNLIEALALMRATPVLPRTTSNSDVRGVLRKGGGAAEWIWKGGKGQAAELELLVSDARGGRSLRHRFAFRGDSRGFRLDDERIESEPAIDGQNDAGFTYWYQDGHPIMNRADQAMLVFSYDSLDLDVSILAQRRDPDNYPEITRLAKGYEEWRIYREWAFGRNTVFREPQKADARNDHLEEDFSNLGLFLSRLSKTPKSKRAILEGMADLYDGLTDFTVVVEGGTVQVFFTEGDFSIPATRVSDGTLRYLCLLAILCDPEPPPLICIEEPELGLHPDILPKLADLLRNASERTQLIVTTHSDILVDAMTETPECVVVCEKHEGRTEMTRLDKDDLAAWLKKYRLGQLWIEGQLGGKRW
jgi:predicted ATPase